jgi:hypothetical protein
MPFQLGELVQMPSVAQILCRILCSVSINETIQASSSSEPCPYFPLVLSDLAEFYIIYIICDIHIYYT